MKLIALNIWGGRIYEPLIEFLRSHGDIDIFCFQEIFHEGTSTRECHKDAFMDIFSRISAVLPKHVGYFSPNQTHEEGVAIFIKKSIPISQTSRIFVFRFENAMENNDSRTMGRNMQYIQFYMNNGNYTVANIHCLWNGMGKTDSPERIEQSNKIKAFLNSVQGKKILCGDFNLLPTTESIAILEKGMKNLISEHGITSTRSSLYAKEGKFADYMFVPPDVVVKEFKVLQETVSDHYPLYLDFE